MRWAKTNCAGYDFRADGTFASVLATMTAAAASSSVSSKLASTIVGSASAQRSSTKGSSTASATQSSSSSGAKAPNGGLSTSDIIAVAVGVPGSIATVVGTVFVVKAYLRKRKALRKQER